MMTTSNNVKRATGDNKKAAASVSYKLSQGRRRGMWEKREEQQGIGIREVEWLDDGLWSYDAGS